MHDASEVGICIICGGPVLEEIQLIYDDPVDFSVIIEPIAQRQYRPATSYHCAQCGLMYKFPPPRNVQHQQP